MRFNNGKFKSHRKNIYFLPRKIGRLIVEEEQRGETRAEYDKYLIKELSVKLTQDYGRGFNERNLWYMKDFYLTFPKLNALRAELTWTHY
ncbi:MAG: DUF1016 N-terminal domain-containing protein [Thermodesulfobacteriota bacterium]